MSTEAIVGGGLVLLGVVMWIVGSHWRSRLVLVVAAGVAAGLLALLPSGTAVGAEPNEFDRCANGDCHEFYIQHDEGRWCTVETCRCAGFECRKAED